MRKIIQDLSLGARSYSQFVTVTFVILFSSLNKLIKGIQSGKKSVMLRVILMGLEVFRLEFYFHLQAIITMSIYDRVIKPSL